MTLNTQKWPKITQNNTIILKRQRITKNRWTGLCYCSKAMSLNSDTFRAETISYLVDWSVNKNSLELVSKSIHCEEDFKHKWQNNPSCILLNMRTKLSTKRDMMWLWKTGVFHHCLAFYKQNKWVGWCWFSEGDRMISSASSWCFCRSLVVWCGSWLRARTWRRRTLRAGSWLSPSSASSWRLSGQWCLPTGPITTNRAGLQQ